MFGSPGGATCPTRSSRSSKPPPRAHAERPAMARKRGGAWELTSWRDYREAVRRAARALVALGRRAGRRRRDPGRQPARVVRRRTSRRPRWARAPAGIYTNSTPEQCRYIAEHAEAVVAVVENAGALAKLQGPAGRPPGCGASCCSTGRAPGPGTLAWADFLARRARPSTRPRWRGAPRRSTASTTSRRSSTPRAPRARPRA